MPKRWCINPECRKLFDADSTGTLRCATCQAKNTQQRNARGNTTQRGYGSQHQRVKAELLQAWQPGDPCALCTRPMTDSRNLDLAHNEDRTGYLGLAHQRCNRATNKG